MKWNKNTLCCAFVLGAGLLNLQVNAGNKEVPLVQHAPDADFKKLLIKSNGKLSRSLRSKFLEKGKISVLSALRKQRKSIDKNLLVWIDSDPEVRDAVYGTIYPADPDILLNLNQLWKEQGAEFTKKYKHLSVGAAVARRGMGVGPLSSFIKFGGMAAFLAEADQANFSLTEFINNRDEEKNEERLSLKRPSGRAEEKAYDAVRDYLKKNSLLVYDAYEDKEKLSEVESILRKHGCKKKGNHCLLYLLMSDGERPEKRTAYPSVSEYFKFLTEIHSIPASKLPLEKGQRWPTFPTTKAPWPLVMPLARTMPMDEVKFIWDKFNGRVDQEANRRVHSYGPYRKGEKAAVGKYKDLPWHWSAWPAVIKQGGVCGTMSTIAMGTATALGRPVLKAGQPKHSCIVGYSYAGNGRYVASVGQSATAGPDGTGTAWLFRDGAAWNLYGHNTNAVHHYGLAQSMNAGLDTYMATRISLHIYRTLSQEQKATLGRKLLFSSLKDNPFNTEVWFTLAYDAEGAKDLLEVFESANDLLSNGAVAESTKMRAADEAIQGADSEGSKAKDTAKNAASYHVYLIRMMTKNAFADARKFNKKDQKLIFKYLSSLNSKDKELKLARDRFESVLKGYKDYMNEVEKEIKLVLKAGENLKGKDKKQDQKIQNDLKNRLHQVNDIIPDRNEREAWLLKLVKSFTAEKAASANKKGKVKLNPAFAELVSSLQKSYKEAPQNKEAIKELNSLKKSFQSAIPVEENEDSQEGKKSKKKDKKKDSKKKDKKKDKK